MLVCLTATVGYAQEVLRGKREDLMPKTPPPYQIPGEGNAGL